LIRIRSLLEINLNRPQLYSRVSEVVLDEGIAVREVVNSLVEDQFLLHNKECLILHEVSLYNIVAYANLSSSSCGWRKNSSRFSLGGVKVVGGKYPVVGRAKGECISSH
jgi:hypothetical protein